MLHRYSLQFPASAATLYEALRGLLGRRVAILLVLVCRVLSARAAQPQGTPPPALRPPTPAHFSWLDPSTWPLLPVPNISVDPNSGETLGIIPTWLQHGKHGDITRIIAPDIVHNTYLGWGADARILDYPSADTQWYLVGGFEQRVNSSFDGLYETGLLRQSPWSFSAEALYDRNGTDRFFGLGNHSQLGAQTVFTDQQLSLDVRVGWNITHAWQLAYTFVTRKVKIIGGHLPGLPSITTVFPHVLGLGTTHEVLHRISLTYDTRDNITIPTRGVDVIAYGGVASRNLAPDDTMFTEAGIDGRFYWSPNPRLTIAVHADLRYMPTLDQAPFWALSSLGGDPSILGGSQTLRGFGQSRFIGRDSFSANIELRQTVLALDALGTRIDVQVTPFYDMGRVFSHSSDFPAAQLHNVFGVGLRGVAAPFVVGYVDVGYGGEGAAVFTGINYPF